MEHPGFPEHLDISSGWPTFWSPPDNRWENRPTVPDDPLQDAPAALKTKEIR